MFKVLFLNIKNPIKNTNPQRAFISNEVLYVLNDMGDTLWKKSTLNFENTSTTSIEYDSRFQNLVVQDINNDTINEVLLTGVIRSKQYFPDTIYCFNFKGDLIRKITSGVFKSLDAERWNHIRTIIRRFLIFNDGIKDRLFLTAYDGLNAPAKISEIDLTTGNELRSFYNSGGLHMNYFMI